VVKKGKGGGEVKGCKGVPNFGPLFIFAGKMGVFSIGKR